MTASSKHIGGYAEVSRFGAVLSRFGAFRPAVMSGSERFGDEPGFGSEVLSFPIGNSEPHNPSQLATGRGQQQHPPALAASLVATMVERREN
jgi:hypothetical protein